MKDRVKFRRFTVGFPAGAMYYSSAKLVFTGFRYHLGSDRFRISSFRSAQES